MSLSSWIKGTSYSKSSRSERRSAPGLTAYHMIGSKQGHADIKNLSSTGIYLQTSERSFPGDVISLTLQRAGIPERNSERRAGVQARTVWRGEDGVGMAFVLPPDIDFDLWNSVLNDPSDEPDPDDIVREFRVAGALAFLTRLCPGSSAELSVLFHRDLGNARIVSATEIAFKAEAMLLFDRNAGRLRADTALVSRIFDEGSWVVDDRVRQFWAGLLIASSTAAKVDQANMTIVDLLSQLTPPQVRIVADASSKATVQMTEDGGLTAERRVCPLEDVMHITGTRDMAKLDRDLAHLYGLGLLERPVNSLALLPSDVASLTPTATALEMYARCNGYRGTLHDFYQVASVVQSAQSA